MTNVVVFKHLINDSPFFLCIEMITWFKILYQNIKSFITSYVFLFTLIIFFKHEELKTIKVVNDVDFSHTVYLISITFENKIPILQLTDPTSVKFSVTISKHLALTHDFVQITCIDTHFCLKRIFFVSTFRNIKY